MQQTQVAARLKGTISSKISGYEDVLAPMVAEACIDVLPKNPVNFNVDNVRVVKIPGGGIMDTRVVKGMVFRRDAEGTIKRAVNAKVAVFAQGVDTPNTDTKVGMTLTAGHRKACLVLPVLDRLCQEALTTAYLLPLSCQGTVLIKNAEELQNSSRSEEAKLEEYIKSIADTGVKVCMCS